MPYASKVSVPPPTGAILTGFRKRCNTRLKTDVMKNVGMTEAPDAGECFGRQMFSQSRGKSIIGSQLRASGRSGIFAR